MEPVGKIERRQLREVWPHEALDFTVWLTENVDVVGDAVGIELVSADREQAAGTFSLDILAEDKDGMPVIIENQLGKSDHDHLGKLLTYLTAFGAHSAVWIVAEPRPEHVRAVTWLNEASSGAFYLLKLEAISIGDSAPAPLLTMIVGPSAETRDVGKVKRERAERDSLRFEYWAEFLEFARLRTGLHSSISPGDSSWVGTSAGIPGLLFSYVVRQHDTQVELYIDRGKNYDEENVRIFRHLVEHKMEIEDRFGGPLDWQQLEGRRACRIRRKLTAGGYRDREEWPSIFEETVDAMVRLEAALRPQLAELR